ncbi:Germacrene A synthase [Colletotrichum spinosum]|uniref:Terpene synthase n=1 Tax=Colletotrichum spinosum TaxID=1347390 RepID=A0A4R8QL67_9PEZI|nr:Germacrene A synthase [Colletotrichum spinosum]
MGSQILEPQAMADILRGQTLHVPDLLGIFRGWPVMANAHYDDIASVVEGAFDRLCKSPTMREKYQRANYARFVSLYYPHPNWGRIPTLALYITWLFCWDDAIDQQGSKLSSNLLHAQSNRAHTLRVLEQVLNIAPFANSLVEYDEVDAELETIGEQLQKFYTFEQRRVYMAHMRTYIENCDKEQSYRLEGTLPDLESYKEMRHGTAAVWTLCALIEYGLGENMPEHVRYMAEVQTLWSETSRAIWITNDILSLKKEIPQSSSTTESIINAIPILVSECGVSPQQAVETLLRELVVSVVTFEKAAAILLEAVGQERREWMQTYCDACRCMVTGSIQFTYESTRYGLAGCLNEDGSLSMVL